MRAVMLNSEFRPNGGCLIQVKSCQQEPVVPQNQPNPPALLPTAVLNSNLVVLRAHPHFQACVYVCG